MRCSVSPLRRHWSRRGELPLKVQVRLQRGEIAPGVRHVEYTKRKTMIPNYKTVSMRDTIYQPGASTSGSSMPNDMVCHMLEGELIVDTGSGDNLYKKGDVWSCAKGMPERSKNNGSTVAIMRTIDLLPT